MIRSAKLICNLLVPGILLGLPVSALAGPTPTPTAAPTAEPTGEPTATPTATPTAEPSVEPTATPTAMSTDSPTPTAEPSVEPTVTPTATPTITPTATPTLPPGATDCLCQVADIEPNQVTLKNVGTGGKGSTLMRNVVLVVHGVDAPGKTCDPGDYSDVTAIKLTIVDDDGDVLVDASKTTVCNADTTTNLKIGVGFEGPMNCENSAVPSGGPGRRQSFSTGEITATGTGSPSTPIRIENTRIKCRSD